MNAPVNKIIEKLIKRPEDALDFYFKASEAESNGNEDFSISLNGKEEKFNIY